MIAFFGKLMKLFQRFLLSTYFFFFGEKEKMHNHVEEIICASGDGEIILHFNHKPHLISLEFLDDCHHIPCNVNDDCLDYCIEKHGHHHYKLFIFWHIQGIRKFKYLIE